MRLEELHRDPEGRAFNIEQKGEGRLWRLVEALVQDNNMKEGGRFSDSESDAMELERNWES